MEPSALRAFRRFVIPKSTGALPLRDAPTVPRLVVRAVLLGLFGALLASMVAWLVSLPLQLVHFGYVTPWGWLGSLVLTLPVTIATALSLLTLAANAVVPPLGLPLGVLLRWSVDAVFWLVAWFPQLPGNLVACRSAPWWLTLGTYFLVLWLVRRRAPDGGEGEVLAGAAGATAVSAVRRGARWLAIPLGAMGLAWALWVLWPSFTRPREFTLHVLAVGNGNAVVLTTPESFAPSAD